MLTQIFVQLAWRRLGSKLIPNRNGVLAAKRMRFQCVPAHLHPWLTVVVYSGLHASIPVWYATKRCQQADTRSFPVVHFQSPRRHVRPSHIVTVGDHSFTTAAKTGTVSPATSVCLSSLTIFRRKLKSHLFQQFYPDIILQYGNGFLSWLFATVVFEHFLLTPL